MFRTVAVGNTILSYERCGECKKLHVWEGYFFEKIGCPRCSYFARGLRALKRRRTWLNRMGPQKEPVKFPSAISNHLYR